MSGSWNRSGLHLEPEAHMGRDWVKVLRPARHKTGHFGDVFPRKQTKPNTTKQGTQEHNDINYNRQEDIQQTNVNLNLNK